MGNKKRSWHFTLSAVQVSMVINKGGFVVKGYWEISIFADQYVSYIFHVQIIIP